jgi:hypothetical protein
MGLRTGPNTFDGWHHVLTHASDNYCRVPCSSHPYKYRKIVDLNSYEALSCDIAMKTALIVARCNSVGVSGPRV